MKFRFVEFLIFAILGTWSLYNLIKEGREAKTKVKEISSSYQPNSRPRILLGKEHVTKFPGSIHEGGPIQISNLSPATVILSLKCPGYDNLIQAFEIQPNQALSLDALGCPPLSEETVEHTWTGRKMLIK